MGRDQAHDGKERHLEAGRQHRFRRKQDQQRGGGDEIVERQSRPLGQHRGEQHGDHDGGPPSGHPAARQSEIDDGRKERADRRPDLDRPGQCQPRRQGEQRAQQEEYATGHQRHMETGDRENMGEPRKLQRLVDVPGKMAALADDLGLSEGADGSGQRRPDAGTDRIAAVVDPIGQHEAGRHGDDPGPADGPAGGSDPVKPQGAGMVITAGKHRTGRRIEQGIDRDGGASAERRGGTAIRISTRRGDARAGMPSSVTPSSRTRRLRSPRGARPMMRPVSSTSPVGAASTGVSSDKVRPLAATKPTAQAAARSQTGASAPRRIWIAMATASPAASSARTPCGSAGRAK
jgi:hypothetical protein